MKRVVLLSLLLSGCAVRFSDDRLDPAKLQAALATLQGNDEALAKALVAHSAEIEALKTASVKGAAK